MTIICYRNGILASDSLITQIDSYSSYASMNKIIKSKKGVLAGACGNTYAVSEFLKYVDSDSYLNPNKPPPDSIFEDSSEFTGLTINKNEEVFL